MRYNLYFGSALTKVAEGQRVRCKSWLKGKFIKLDTYPGFLNPVVCLFGPGTQPKPYVPDASDIKGAFAIFEDNSDE